MDRGIVQKEQLISRSLRMLSYSELVSLERSIRDARVLSIYLDGTPADPAGSDAWRLRLDHALDAAREREQHASREDQEDFAEAERRAREALAARPPAIGPVGWAGFITPDRLVHAAAIDAPVPDLAVWKTGACIVPYIAAIQHAPSAVAVIVDARRAVVYHLDRGTLDRGEAFHASHVVAEAAHMGAAPAVGFHSGTRGTTGHDAAQRSLREGTQRMLRLAADRASALAAGREPVILGGIARVTAHAATMLESLQDRVVVTRSLDVHATPPQIADVARRVASTFRDTHLAGVLDDVVEQAGADGLAMLGATDIRKALVDHAVNELFLSAHYATHHSTHAEGIARLAMDQNAHVYVVGGTVGEQLDAHGGVAARLRYRASARLV
jgi:hypothetical protein